MRLATSTRLCLGAILVAMLATWSVSITPSAFAWGRPIDLDLSGVSCPESPNCKIFRPEMAAESNHVHLIYMNGNNEGLYYHRGTTDDQGNVTWERGRLLATSVSRSNDGIGIAADNAGTVHIAYSSGKQLYYIKNTNQGSGGWSNPELISSSNGNRVVQVGIALDSNRAPYVTWGQGIDPAYLAFAYREDGGNWKSTRLEGSRQYLHSNVRIAVTGAGATAVAHIFADTQRKKTDNTFNITYARVQRAGGESVSNWSYPFDNSNDSDKFPSVTVDPVTNYIYAGYVDGTNSGGYRWALSMSMDNGATWTQPFNVAPYGSSFWGDYTPMIAYNGTVYMMIQVKQMEGVDVAKWGFADVRYSQQNNNLSSPQAILNYADSNRKVDRFIAYAISRNAKVGVWIRNYTDGPGYNSDLGGIDQAVKPSGQVTINNGDGSTKSATLNIALSNVVGDQANLKMRVAVDSTLTDATPLENFQTNFTRTVTDLGRCAHTVSVQLVDTAKNVPSDIFSDDIVIDSQVQADSIVRNPYKRGNAVVFSQLAQASPLVTDGDAEYTRVAAFYIEVNGIQECSQLKTVRVGRSASSLPLSYNISSNFFANVLPIPGQLVVGSNTIVLQVEDSVGNTQTYSREIKYDPTPPTMVTTGTLEINVPTTGANILAGLQVSGEEIRDNMYPGRGFWGVWVANSRTQVADPVNDQTLTWQPVAINGTESSFTLANWSLLGGLPASQQTPGDYYVYVRFLDGAGNPTAGYLSQKVTLDQIVRPTTSLPAVVKQ